MKSDSQKKQIVVIDCQDYWRDLSRNTLEAEGFSVQVLDHYNYPPAAGLQPGENPNLVILGCATIGPQELNLITRILEQKLHLLVLSTSLPWQVMRHLFLVGADDVMENKPYNPTRLVNIVTEALEHAASRDSDEAVEEGNP